MQGRAAFAIATAERTDSVNPSQLAKGQVFKATLATRVIPSRIRDTIFGSRENSAITGRRGIDR
jgi:hypothetical protein